MKIIKKILIKKILEFYEKYKNVYEFDDLMNVNCKYGVSSNSICCINCYCCIEAFYARIAMVVNHV